MDNTGQVPEELRRELTRLRQMIVHVEATPIAQSHPAEEHSQRLAGDPPQQQQMEAIETMVGGIAHAFNNMLCAILGFTELTLYEVPVASMAWNNLQEVLQAGRRAQDLMQQLLAFSRQSAPQRRPVELRVLLEDVLTILRTSLPSTIEMRCNIPTESRTTIFADPVQIRQVLHHLFTNAEHAMRETGGILRVHLEAVDVEAPLALQQTALSPGAYVCLSIGDTGHGMSPQVMARIYEPFFTTKEVGVGIGMGLPVVHGIVLSHEGAITVESQAGQGTTFTIYLPRLEGADALVPRC